MIPHLGQCLILAATEAEAAESVVPNWVKILVTAGVFLVPYGLGVLIARQLKLKEYAFRISLVLFAATLGLMPFAYQSIVGALEQKHYDEKLAEYEAEKNEFKVTQEALDKLQQVHPRLKINRPGESVPTPEISPAGEGE
jgi:hypothetical protein